MFHILPGAIAIARLVARLSGAASQAPNSGERSTARTTTDRISLRGPGPSITGRLTRGFGLSVFPGTPPDSLSGARTARPTISASAPGPREPPPLQPEMPRRHRHAGRSSRSHHCDGRPPPAPVPALQCGDGAASLLATVRLSSAVASTVPVPRRADRCRGPLAPRPAPSRCRSAAPPAASPPLVRRAVSCR